MGALFLLHVRYEARIFYSTSFTAFPLRKDLLGECVCVIHMHLCKFTKKGLSFMSPYIRDD